MEELHSLQLLSIGLRSGQSAFVVARIRRPSHVWDAIAPSSTNASGVALVATLVRALNAPRFCWLAGGGSDGTGTTATSRGAYMPCIFGSRRSQPGFIERTERARKPVVVDCVSRVQKQKIVRPHAPTSAGRRNEPGKHALVVRLIVRLQRAEAHGSDVQRVPLNILRTKEGLCRMLLARRRRRRAVYTPCLVKLD